MLYFVLLACLATANAGGITFQQPSDELFCGETLVLQWAYDDADDWSDGDFVAIELYWDKLGPRNTLVSVITTVAYPKVSYNWKVPSPLPGWRSNFGEDGAKTGKNVYIRLSKLSAQGDVNNDPGFSSAFQWSDFKFTCCPNGEIGCACVAGDRCTDMFSVCQGGNCIQRAGVSGELGEPCRVLTPRCEGDLTCQEGRCKIAPKMGQLDGPCRLTSPKCDNDGQCKEGICGPPIGRGQAGFIKFDQPQDVVCGTNIPLKWSFEMPMAWTEEDKLKITLWYDELGNDNSAVDTLAVVPAIPSEYLWRVPSFFPELWQKAFGDQGSVYLRLTKLTDESTNNDPQTFWSSFKLSCEPAKVGEAGGSCRDSTPKCDDNNTCEEDVCVPMMTPMPPVDTTIDSGKILFIQPTAPLKCGMEPTHTWSYAEPTRWSPGDIIDIELWYDSRLPINSKIADLGSVMYPENSFSWKIPDPLPQLWTSALKDRPLVFLYIRKRGNSASSNKPGALEAWPNFELHCCPSGVRGCPCSEGGACSNAVDVCDAGTCIAPPAGTATSLCRPTEPKCDAGLACVDDHCAAVAGCSPLGSKNCRCDNGLCNDVSLQCVDDLCLTVAAGQLQGSTCAADATLCHKQQTPPLACIAGTCQQCKPKQESCVCGVNNSCNDPDRFICDNFNRCVPKAVQGETPSDPSCTPGVLGCACNNGECEPSERADVVVACRDDFCKSVAAVPTTTKASVLSVSSAIVVVTALLFV